MSAAPFPPSLINAKVPNPQTMTVGEEILEGGPVFRSLVAQFYNWMFTTGLDANGNTIPVPTEAFSTMICQMNCGQPTTTTAGTGPTTSSSTSTRSTTSSSSSSSTTTLQSLAITFLPTPTGAARTTPYPSTRYYPNVVSPAHTLTLNLVGFSSNYSGYVWMVLQAPNGVAALIMAHNGSTSPVTGQMISISSGPLTLQAFPCAPPADGPNLTADYVINICGGSGSGIAPYGTTNLPSPAPQMNEGWPQTTGAQMLALTSGGTQGTWKLWVCVLGPTGAGSITDWSLTIS